MSTFYNSLRNIMFIDIETISGKPSYDKLPERMKKLWDHKAKLIDDSQLPANLYFKKAGIYAEFGKVITIGVGFFYFDQKKELNFKVKSLYGNNEKMLLEEFILLIEQKFKNKKIIFCAHNGKEFDYPYLCRRMLINALEIPKSLNSSGKKPWQVEHLDTLDLWKFGDRKNYSSLELLAAIFEIPGSKANMDGSKVNEAYYIDNELEKIAMYCREDVLVTAQVFLKLHNKPLIKAENIEML